MIRSLQSQLENVKGVQINVKIILQRFRKDNLCVRDEGGICSI